jgi:ABC-type nickel/cobalt efflux system permease component RcnA
MSFTAILMLFLVTPLAAAAHPLGNFTINQYLGLLITGDGVEVDYVVDMAEIPAFQEQLLIDTGGDKAVSEDEKAVYLAKACADRAVGITIAVDRASTALVETGAVLTFPPGQAGLSTLRLECAYRAAATGSVLEVENVNYSERIGWREIVVTSRGVDVSSDFPGQSNSARLTAYPQNPSAATPDLRRGSVEIGTTATTGSPAVVASPTGLPVDALGSLINRGGVGFGAAMVALLAALVLGAGHALAPGHGKSIMAAYLVGNRGTVRQAAGLGLAVAVSHTLGVAALGAITLVATSSFRPERVYPYLSVLSGLIVLIIGIGLIARAIRRVLHQRTHEAGHQDDHHHHDHSHQQPDLSDTLGWKTLTTLGLSGGLVPSASAVVLLLGAVHLGRVEFGLALIAAFGVGMALSMVAVGLGLVAASRISMRRITSATLAARLATAIPAVMGIFVTTAGLVMVTRGGSAIFGA